MNEGIIVAEKLYREINPMSKMDTPSFVYEKVENMNKLRIKTKSPLSLYDFCIKTLKKNE